MRNDEKPQTKPNGGYVCATRSYTWDFENRLAGVTMPGTGGTATFKYDPLGRRIEKVAPDGTTVYAYDGDNVTEELGGGGNLLAHYTQGAGIDQPLALTGTGGTYFYHADGLGSITSLTGGSGQLAGSYVYDSFGNLTASTGTITNPFQYTGREFDSETGLYYYRARYYDYASGRFISNDPLRFGGGRNFYTYTGNNPLIFADPSGLSKICNIPPVGPCTNLPLPITRCASGPLIGCLIEVESRGDPNAKSKKGAVGILQVTPIIQDALQSYGLLTPGMSADDEGHTYFNLLLTYCENTTYAIAAYDAGPTAVNRAGGNTQQGIEKRSETSE